MFTKRKVKKTVTMLVLLVMMGMSFAGCGSSSSNTREKGTPVVKDVTLTIWHFMNDRDALMKEYAKEYQDKTGVKVDFQLLSADVMKQKQQAAAVAHTLPDAWTFSGGVGDICRYADSGSILPVDSYLTQWDRFPKSILETYAVTEASRSTSENKTAPIGNYIIPLDTNNMQIIYNKDLFKKAGLDPEKPPKTWTEFIAAGKALRAANIVPFASGLGSWAQATLCYDFQYEFMGFDNISNARQGKIKFADSGLEAALNEFVEMGNAKMYADGSATMDLPAAEKLFVNGKVGMLYDGSWALGVFKGMNPNFQNYGVFVTPKDERAKYDMKIAGGAGAFFTVSKESKNVKETMDFLNWLTDKEQQVKYANTSLNLPANKNITDADKLSPQLLQFSAAMSMTQPSTPGEHASIGDIFVKGVSQIIHGTMTPAQLVKQMDDNNNK